MIVKQAFIALTSALVLCQAGNALAADDFPSKPFRIEVGFVPGGGTDIVARILAQRLSTVTGQQVIVENRAGASGLLAADWVSRSEPDGYTLLLSNTQSSVASPHMLPVSFDPLKGLTPVRYVGFVPNVLVINPQKNNFKSVSELIAAVRAHPGKFTYASSGPGSTQHLAGARFSQIENLSMEHIPYKGSGQALADLLGGQVDMNFDTLPSVVNQIKAGKLRALAVTTSTRSQEIPDVPTMTEAGVKGMDIMQWYAVFTPAGLSAPVLAKLDHILADTVKDPTVRKRLLEQGMEVGGGPDTPAALRAYVDQDWARYGKLIDSLGLAKP